MVEGADALKDVPPASRLPIPMKTTLLIPGPNLASRTPFHFIRNCPTTSGVRFLAKPRVPVAQKVARAADPV